MVPDDAPLKTFELIPFDQIKFDGKEEWRVKGLLPRQGVAAFFGAKSAFKSFAAQDVNFHIALGWKWAGRRVEQAPVIYIAAEGAAGLKKRKAGFETRHAKRLPKNIPFYLISSAPNLGIGQDDLRALIAAVESAGVMPGMITLDTVAQTLGSAEENGAGMVQLIANAQALANHFHCLVLLIHHSGLADAERLRGHSSLGCALDAIAHFERKDGSLSGVMTIQKMKEENDTNLAFDIALSRAVIGKDADGDDISTLVVEAVEQQDVKPRASKCGNEVQIVTEQFAKVYDFLADGKPKTAGLDGKPVIKVDLNAIRDELKNRNFLHPDDKGAISAKSRKHFERAQLGWLQRGVFVSRKDKIWRVT